MLDDAGAAAEQQVVALAGRSTVEVEIAGPGLIEQMLTDAGAQLHRLHVLAEQLHSGTSLRENVVFRISGFILLQQSYRNYHRKKSAIPEIENRFQIRLTNEGCRDRFGNDFHFGILS